MKWLAFVYDIGYDNSGALWDGIVSLQIGLKIR